MDDYLNTGGVRNQLEILSQAPSSIAKRPSFQNQELFLQGYGRLWGEKFTYSVGMAYATGLAFGGTFGFLHGIRKGGATPKLLLNSVLNSCATQGSGLANQAAVLTSFYWLFNMIVKTARGPVDDPFNAAAAGCLSGALYSFSRGLKTLMKYSATTTVVFTGVDYAFRRGYF